MSSVTSGWTRLAEVVLGCEALWRQIKSANLTLKRRVTRCALHRRLGKGARVTRTGKPFSAGRSRPPVSWACARYSSWQVAQVTWRTPSGSRTLAPNALLNTNNGLCAGNVCHTAGAMPGGDLDLTSPNLASRLVNVNAPHAGIDMEAGGVSCPQAKLIDTANPMASWILVKTNDMQGNCGENMPETGTFSATDKQCLDSYVQTLITNANAGGAGNGGSGGASTGGGSGGASTAGGGGSGGASTAGGSGGASTAGGSGGAGMAGRGGSGGTGTAGRGGSGGAGMAGGASSAGASGASNGGSGGASGGASAGTGGM
jgi:hypothetical protein